MLPEFGSHVRSDGKDRTELRDCGGDSGVVLLQPCVEPSEGLELLDRELRSGLDAVAVVPLLRIARAHGGASEHREALIGSSVEWLQEVEELAGEEPVGLDAEDQLWAIERCCVEAVANSVVDILTRLKAGDSRAQADA